MNADVRLHIIYGCGINTCINDPLGELQVNALPIHAEWTQSTSGPEVIKLFFMLNSAEHEIFSANKI